MTWGLGLRHSAGKRRWWSNHWLTHECRDLALPFEMGVRAYHHHEENR